jgi:hypothetical protein
MTVITRPKMAPKSTKTKSVSKTSPAKKKTTTTRQLDPVDLTVDQMIQVLDETKNYITISETDMQVKEIHEELNNKGQYKIKRVWEKKNLEAIKEVIVVDEDEINKMLKEGEDVSAEE